MTPNKLIFLTLLLNPAFTLATTIDFSKSEPNEALSGGATTVFNATVNAFSLPAANMPISRRDNFSIGNAFFRQPWVTAPSTTTARDGLGALFITNACQNCHIKDGRGSPPAKADDDFVSILLRLSLPAITDAQKAQIKQSGVIAEPTYGDQLQNFSVQGVPAEGKPTVTYTEIPITFADGEVLTLRQPKYEIKNLQYGELHKEVLISPRVAQPMIGLGLVDAIPEASILANADPEDKNGDGISGRPNHVWDVEKKQTVMGRIGWKANMPHIRQQTAGAFNGDIGITSVLFPTSSCTDSQTACKNAPNGGEPEISTELLDFVTFYARTLAVPARRNVDDPIVLKGKAVFYTANCTGCHTPTFQTGEFAGLPEVSKQAIRPYSDFLLHDMGDGLADARPDFEATGNEWRTQPLWGIGLTETVNGHTQFLHDGRARNLMEAVLWHGGEAEQAKQAVLKLAKPEREALIKFLESL
ncbi:di-heme oxidoredictase family protein [Beggiatoa leptomitoformis]|uniref:C-type cytochrome n=1 Tax=Beggiatoa leptomitoformis TaxID=288004 RepID=A0A2N9Y9V3_9GAMM|nr:di-heme oxidoredictase family protein [Beggiatoa leptomitoformis]ALG67328.1 c-type cytochrome [Beggiatoa leptomitoformis]AUI67235.1 c-type cytochrome [Beggiatoa leptomitoformis]